MQAGRVLLPTTKPRLTRQKQFHFITLMGPDKEYENLMDSLHNSIWNEKVGYLAH
jgi:hypothetical protein